MTLSGRLSAFFLGALAVILVGFGASLYWLTRADLHRQVRDRLGAALATLAAAVERESDGLEWEPAQRHIELGRAASLDEVRWEVRDGQGKLVDRSPNLAGDSEWLSGAETGAARDAAGRRWRLASSRLESGDGPTAPGRYAALVLTAGVCTEPVQEALRRLELTVGGVGVGLWLAAALAGRWWCRRALAPVTRMAQAAHAMGAARLAERLPVPRTGDELAELGRSFNELLGRLEEAFERQRRFAGDASHQLRTPLAAMLGQIEVALRRERSAADYRDTLERARGQAEHLRRVIESLLFLARADAESEPGGLEAVELAGWAAEHLEHWSGHPRCSDLLLLAPAAGGLWVRAQPALLGQLLDNLLENACKHSPPGTPITVRLGGEPGAATLTVEDQGSGIAAEDLPHVFEPFYRSAGVRRQGLPGVGLGLAVARRVAQAFGGTLAAASEPGQWARFTLRLPAADPAAPARETPAA